MRSVAVYAGSFDPLTLGHLDVIERVAPLFDQLHLLVAVNSEKKTLFSQKERVKLLVDAVTPHLSEDRFTVVAHEGLTVDYCKKVSAKVLIRGLRAVSDFEKELQMATMNRHLHPEIETLNVMTDEKYLFISSSLVKEIAKYGGPLKDLVPPNVAQALEKKYIKKE